MNGLRIIGLILAGAIATTSTPAQAATVYYYTFVFGAFGSLPESNVTVYSPTLLSALGDSTSIIYSGNVNGFVPTAVEVNGTFGAHATLFSSAPEPTGYEPYNTISGFIWGSPTPVTGGGIYPTASGAGRIYSSGTGGWTALYTSGLLIVTPAEVGGSDPEPPPFVGVPEPAALMLLGLGACLAATLRRRVGNRA
jgi:hypothetical protein